MAKLTLKQANTIIEKAFAKAAEMKVKPLGVVVIDDRWCRVQLGVRVTF